MAAHAATKEAPAEAGTKVHPLDDHIVVRPLEPEGKSRGGILLPDVAKRKTQRGTVLAMGPGWMTKDGMRRVGSLLKEGDEVLFSQYSGSEVEIDGQELRILRSSDIMAKLGGERPYG